MYIFDACTYLVCLVQSIIAIKPENSSLLHSLILTWMIRSVYTCMAAHACALIYCSYTEYNYYLYMLTYEIGII